MLAIVAMQLGVVDLTATFTPASTSILQQLPLPAGCVCVALRLWAAHAPRQFLTDVPNTIATLTGFVRTLAAHPLPADVLPLVVALLRQAELLATVDPGRLRALPVIPWVLMAAGVRMEWGGSAGARSLNIAAHLLPLLTFCICRVG